MHQTYFSILILTCKILLAFCFEKHTEFFKSDKMENKVSSDNIKSQ